MKKMKSLAVAMLFSFAAISFYQCTNDEDLFKGFEHEPDFHSLQEVHDMMNVSDTATTTITNVATVNIFNGPKGTRLTFPENSIKLVSGGEPVTPVTLKMVEVYKGGEIVRHNMQTFKNQSSMISGGIFWLGGTDATGSEIKVEGAQAILPYKTKAAGYQEDMSYHSGQLQTKPSGNVNSWTSGSGNVTYDAAAGTNGEFTIENIGAGWNAPLSAYDFGESSGTQFSVQITNSSNLEKTEVFFVSSDYTLVAALTNAENGILSAQAGSIPNGMSGKLVAIALIDGKLSFGAQDVVINGSDSFSFGINEGELAALNALLNGIN